VPGICIEVGEPSAQIKLYSCIPTDFKTVGFIYLCTRIASELSIGKEKRPLLLLNGEIRGKNETSEV
jgi:hypothetical protein